jgi:RNA polymerase sigma factor (sigma-70 family)
VNAEVVEQMQLSKIKLVNASLQGDEGAMDKLFSRDASTLHRIAFRVLRNREDAQDAVQDALLSAFCHLGDFDGRAPFRSWLTRIVSKADCGRRIRQERKQRVRLIGRTLRLLNTLQGIPQVERQLAVHAQHFHRAID